MRGVGLGVALRLDLGQGVGKRLTRAHGVDDEVGRRVEHRLETEQRAVGQGALEQAEHRETVHHRTLEADAPAGGVGGRLDPAPVPGDGAFVGGDHVHAESEGGFHVAGGDGGEVILHHRELDEHVGAGGGHEVGGTARRLREARRDRAGRASAVRDGAGQHVSRLHALRREKASVARAGGAHQHAQPVILGECALLAGEQRAEFARHAAEAEQAEADGAQAGAAPWSRAAARAGGRRLPGRHQRTDRERSPTASTSRSSSPAVLYGASPTRIRPPRCRSPSTSTSRIA